MWMKSVNDFWYFLATEKMMIKLFFSWRKWEVRIQWTQRLPLDQKSVAECAWQHTMVEPPLSPSQENPMLYDICLFLLYIGPLRPSAPYYCLYWYHDVCSTKTIIQTAKNLGCNLDGSQGLQRRLHLITVLVLHLPSGNTCTQLPYPWFGSFCTNT